MKKLLSIILIAAMSFGCLCSCKKDEEDGQDVEIISSDVVVDEDEPELTPEMFEELHPEEIKIRSICQLATMEVYFHNVAKAVKPAASGLMGIGQIDRRFWVEYNGTATVGIDMNSVSMDIKDNVVTVTMPHARLLDGLSIDAASYTIDSIVVEPESFTINTNEIEAEDVTKSIREANIYAQASIINNRTIMNGAEQRAEALIKNYITQLSKMSGQEYRVEFVYIDSLDNR